jgi:hypothetical protein
MSVDASNIDTVLALNNGHSWLDGSGNIDSAVWSTRIYPNDTLTITLSVNNGAPTVTVGDIITLDGNIKDRGGKGIVGSVTIGGGF